MADVHLVNGADAATGSADAATALAVKNEPSYIVAGPADDEDFARAEHLAELLMSSLPGLRCRVIPVLPEQWPEYCMKLTARLGCSARCPIVWAGTGKSLGGSITLGLEPWTCLDPSASPRPALRASLLRSLPASIPTVAVTEFETTCDTKYGVRIPQVEPGTWAKIAQENLAALRLKLSGALPSLEPTGSGG